MQFNADREGLHTESFGISQQGKEVCETRDFGTLISEICRENEGIATLQTSSTWIREEERDERINCCLRCNRKLMGKIRVKWLITRQAFSTSDSRKDKQKLPTTRACSFFTTSRKVSSSKAHRIYSITPPVSNETE